MRTTQCKICGGTDILNLFNSFNMHGRHILNKNDTFTIAQCNDCKIVFPLGIEYTESYYQQYYPQDYYIIQNKTSILESMVQILQWIAIRKIEKAILTHYPMGSKKTLRLIDIGCGSGEFLTRLHNPIFDKCGIEINKNGYQLCIKKGLEVYNQELEKCNFQEKSFDVITLFHVLEHVPEPHSLFKSIHKILKDDGIIILATPDTNSLGFRIGKELWFHLDSPRHVLLYNTSNMKLLMEMNGFQIINIINSYYDYPLDLFWSVRKSKSRYLIYPIYPFMKYLSRESHLFICKKS